MGIAKKQVQAIADEIISPNIKKQANEVKLCVETGRDSAKWFIH